ncbi:hypothetical protein GCM10022297_09670 [Lactobacillus hamsteri]|uniref:Uncharacterized protein n=1 Tax=Lactobacillus hamsteri DSM 5661 = JCM 6256 TaxID=1423754 RepID=A0A0R1YC09_9LACO|nr:Abi-alpha family protein [Lactobacillus hamsteri]KRM39933.1 hypothetical protein FC39_GL000934 [Lactobacillus hamsteri DSM 5661 = JCM 6256]
MSFGEFKDLYDLLPNESRTAFWNPILGTLGKGISGILYWIFNKPIEYKAVKEQDLKNLLTEMAQKMKDVPEDCRDSSKFGLVLETLQHSVYQLNQEELRAMLANLVASLADKRKNSSITPRYIYILSQLGYNDAVFLRELVHQNGKNILHAHKGAVNNGRINKYISGYFLYFSGEKKVLSGFESSINVLDSLGIIKDSDERIESQIKDDNIVKKLNEKAQNDQDGYWMYKDIFITSFGIDFLKYVVG